jgi:SAM-dependent methyltransferase
MEKKKRTSRRKKYTPLKKINEINKVFDKSTFISLDSKAKGPEYSLTYGEITSDAIQSIVDYIKTQDLLYTTFIDLGCGSGRSLAMAINNGFLHAKGVEIAEERYECAVKSCEKLSLKLKNSINIVQNDLFELESEFFPEDDNYVIFVSNLCYPVATNERLFEFLSKQTKPGTLLCVSRTPKKYGDFEFITKIKTPMTWNKNAECYVFRRK